MSDTQTDTFEHGIGVLAHGNKQTNDIQVSDPITVNGVLIPEETIVQGGQGERHFFTEEALAEAERVIRDQLDAETVHLVKNFHELEGQAPADDIIGELLGVRHSPGLGLLFEGEVADREIAEKVANGYLSVSPSIARALGEYDPQRDARPVESVAGLRDAAIVGRGQPGASVELGPNPAVEALSRSAFDALEAADGENGGENETMSLDEAKETLAEEYDLDPDDVEARLTETDERDELPDGTVRLIEQ